MAGKGGARLGAGRKRKEIKALGNEFWANVISLNTLKANLGKLAKSDNERIALEANMAIAEHIFGKPTQRIAGDEDEPVVIRVIADI